MMGRSELCAWLRANSSGIYRPAAEAADEIEHLAAAKDQHFQQAMVNGAKANEYRAALVNLRAAMADATNTNIVDYIDAVLGGCITLELTGQDRRETMNEAENDTPGLVRLSEVLGPNQPEREDADAP